MRGWMMTGMMALALLASTATAAEEPGPAEVRDAVQLRLDQTFGEGVFKARRTQSLEAQPHGSPGDEHAWLLVRYTTELKLLQDYRLSSWDTLNIGTLVQLLGSNPRGVRGVAAVGNHRGDVLQIEGTMAFVQEADQWLPSLSSARIESAAQTAVPPSPIRDELEQRIAEIGASLEDDDPDVGGLDLGADLEQIVADVECRLADRRGMVRLATAAATTEYFALGTGLAEVLGADRLHVRQTTGSVDNVLLLHDGLVDAALIQNDIAHLAYAGLGPFQGKLPMTELRALAALFPEQVHVVTVRGSGIENLADLRGAAVDIGPDDSGSRFNAAQVLAAAGLTLGDLGRVQGSAPGDALDDLVAGRLQAAIMTGAPPYPEVSSHAIAAPLQLLSLTDEQVAELTRDAPYLLPMTIPARTYPGQEEPVKTLGVSALLVAREELADEIAVELVETLMADDTPLAQHTVQAWYISPWTAERGLPLPLHPAAAQAIERLRAGTGGR
jgi:TRAP transporter TAXI family solute receptor